MKNTYAIELKLCATAYIKAESKAEAISMLRTAIDERHGSDYGDFEIDDFDADITLSPAMTVWGPWGEWNEMESAE